MDMLKELQKGAVHAAPLLLGYILLHDSPQGITGGYIVEVEAYTQDDPASHTYKGQTIRNAAMFCEAGTVYVYFTYGMHYCVNVVCSTVGRGEGILIRALQPVEGVELMKQRRQMDDVSQLTNGPAKLVQALGITRDHNLGSIVDGPVRLVPGFVPETVGVSRRIGIKLATDLPRRFYVAGNPFVSHPAKNMG